MNEHESWQPNRIRDSPGYQVNAPHAVRRVIVCFRASSGLFHEAGKVNIHAIYRSERPAHRRTARVLDHPIQPPLVLNLWGKLAPYLDRLLRELRKLALLDETLLRQ